MSNTSNGGPAFPVPMVEDSNGDLIPVGYRGMTLRDYFAGIALQKASFPTCREEAEFAYQAADAMLKARLK